MVPALPLFLSLARTAFNAVANQYIDSGTATQFINLGFEAAQNLADADVKLLAIRDELVLKKNEAAQSGETWAPRQDEIDAIWDRINARDAEWDQI